MHAERLLYSIRVPSLVLIAQAVFLLECGQTDRQTDASQGNTHAGGYAVVGINNDNSLGLDCVHVERQVVKLFAQLDNGWNVHLT